MIKLIASDLDGTLLQNGSTKVPEEFFDTIRECKKKGILFAAASGRQYQSLRCLFDEVKDDIAYICENGALTIYQGEIIDRRVVEQSLAEQIIRAIEAEEGTEALVSGTYTSYLHPKEPYIEAHIKSIGNNYKVVPDLTKIGEPIIKLALYERAGTESRNRREYWQKKMPEPVKVVTSGALWLDMLFPDVHKGVGIRALAKHLGIEKSEIMSFGDNLNDMEMFEASGVSVAVENAKPEVLDACQYKTPTVDAFVKKYCFDRS